MRFFLDDLPLDVDIPPALEFSNGTDECLSRLSGDPALECEWYESGYSITSFEHFLKHYELLASLENIVKYKLECIFPEKRFNGFSLKNYHHYVSEDEHRRVADPVLKRLYLKDLPGIADVFVECISQIFKTKMDFKRRHGDNSEHWIILRLNPPHSFAYNPPHKDIYEDFDTHGFCPQMINAWIPVAGVSSLAGLGLAPSSHLLPESEILRTKAGAKMNNRKFSVNMIKSWGGSNKLVNIYPQEGRMLCFSSHLVHGLGINRSSRFTRVALEFRLHKQQSYA